MEALGAADDYAEADGDAVLDFWQAVEKAQKLAKPVASGPLTVGAALSSYFEYLIDQGKSYRDSEYRAKAYILPMLGNLRVASLTAEMLRKWLAGMVKVPPRVRTKKGEKQQHRMGGDRRAG